MRGAELTHCAKKNYSNMKQSIIDEVMNDFVNSYQTGTVWGQHGVKLDLDKLVRTQMEALYDRLVKNGGTIIIKLDEGENAADASAEVAGLIEQGFTSGHNPNWELTKN